MNRRTGVLLKILASRESERLGIAAMKIAIAVVFIWIGGLKFVPYEADSITPFVANSPLMSFFYAEPAQYKSHVIREGELDPAKRQWQIENNTYGFSDGLGVVEVLIGTLTLCGLFSLRLGMLGALLGFLTSFVTLSFLVTTPEAWVPSLGDAEYGFPYLSSAGRLVLKDTLLLAGAWLLLVEGARRALAEPIPSGAEDREQFRISPAPNLTVGGARSAPDRTFGMKDRTPGRWPGSPPINSAAPTPGAAASKRPTSLETNHLDDGGPASGCSSTINTGARQ